MKKIKANHSSIESRNPIESKIYYDKSKYIPNYLVYKTEVSKPFSFHFDPQLFNVSEPMMQMMDLVHQYWLFLGRKQIRIRRRGRRLLDKGLKG